MMSRDCVDTGRGRNFDECREDFERAFVFVTAIVIHQYPELIFLLDTLQPATAPAFPAGAFRDFYSAARSAGVLKTCRSGRLRRA